MQDAEPELEAESSQELAPGAQEGEGGAGGGTQFTCFTGTKSTTADTDSGAGTQFTCFTGTELQILTPALQEVVPALRSRCGRSIGSRTYTDVYADVC